jgi:hypothetical protein
MGRTRSTITRTRHLKTASSSSATTPPSVPELFTKAQSLVEQCNYQLAARFLQRILETDAMHVEARELLGVVQLESGDLDAAQLVCPKKAFSWIRPLAEKFGGGGITILDISDARTAVSVRAGPWSSFSPLASRTNL